MSELTSISCCACLGKLDRDVYSLGSRRIKTLFEECTGLEINSPEEQLICSRCHKKCTEWNAFRLMTHQNHKSPFAKFQDPLSHHNSSSAFVDIVKEYRITNIQEQTSTTPQVTPLEIKPTPKQEKATPNNSNKSNIAVNVDHLLTKANESQKLLKEIMPLLSFVANTLGYSDTGTTDPVATETIEVLQVLGYPDEEEEKETTLPSVAVPNKPAPKVKETSKLKVPARAKKVPKLEQEDFDWPMEEEEEEVKPEFPVTTIEDFREMEHRMEKDKRYLDKVRKRLKKQKYGIKGLKGLVTDEVLDNFTTSPQHVNTNGKIRTLTSNSRFFKDVMKLWKNEKEFRSYFTSCRKRISSKRYKVHLRMQNEDSSVK